MPIFQQNAFKIANVRNLSIEQKRRLTLALINQKGLGRKSVKTLFDFYGDLDQIVLQYKELDISDDVKLKIVNAISSEPEIYKLEKELERRCISYLCFWEDGFPSGLRNMPDPPIIIFYKGNYKKETLDKSILVVGTRKITEYGKKAANFICSQLSQNGFCIVSGLAFGIDAEAHKSTFHNGGYTAAILAGSVDNCLPKGNISIYNQILDSGGVIISEYLPNTNVVAGMFAERNRLVAGISMATLVIEAPNKSGSLITADLALDYNKDVFCIPGSIFTENAKGSNDLIKNSKAKLVTNADDILEELGYSTDEIGGKVKNNKFLESLTKDESDVYSFIALKTLNEMDLSLELNWTIDKVTSVCSVLELKDLIRKNIYGNYELA